MSGTLRCANKLADALLPVELPGIYHRGRQPGQDPVEELFECELAASETADLAWSAEKDKESMIEGFKKIQNWMARNAVGPEDTTHTIGRIGEARYLALDWDDVSESGRKRGEAAAEAIAKKKARPNPNPNPHSNQQPNRR